MNDLVDNTPKRKVLSLKKEKDVAPVNGNTSPKFLREELSAYMVWCPDGEMPKRVYQADEQKRAIGHAKSLATQTGKRFYVMRTWRGFDAE